MGQAIVYCSNCSAQLRGADFEARRAFKVDDLHFCAKCCREIMGDVPAPPPKPPPPPTRSPSHNTSRIGLAAVPPPPAPPSTGAPPYGIIAGVALAAVAIVAAVVVSGGSEDRRRSNPPAPPTAVAAPSPEAPRSSAREAAAQEALAKALRTEDLAARHVLLADAVAKASGTPLYEDARRELDRVERKIQETAKADPVKAPDPLPPPPAPVPAPTADPKPAPAPAPATPSPEEADRIARWQAALLPATGRDYAAAAAALEKLGTAAADLPLLKSVASLQQESVLALKNTAKGQKLAIDFRDGKAEGLFVEVENGHVELGALEVEIGEILPSSLVDLLKSRGTAVDPAAAALFCLLEGDEAGARRLAGDKAAAIPDRYWTYARTVAATREPARGLFQEALALSAAFATAADAVPRFQALLRDHADSAFVRRNKASLAARLQKCARDFLFVAADLEPSGAFKAARSPKGTICWTSEADSDPSKRDTFVDLSFSALADTSYKCWIYAGACCQETFEFTVQGTEMKAGKEKESVEPGSGAATVMKPLFSSLKKTHAGHTGPKQPSHWEWIEIALPKYAKSGPQQLRVLTAQKGFSVAWACVTAMRTGTPREFELREIEKVRGGPVVASPGPKATVLFALALDGSDTHLLGEVRDKALYGVPQFGAVFAGIEAGGFTMPPQGEFRMIYLLKSATTLKVRFRVRRSGDGKSDPYDVEVPNPAVGRPTEVRFPFSAFKSTEGPAAPPLTAGDAIPMIYVIGRDANCGLRVDALSVVEIKSEAAATTKLLYSENFDAGPGRFTDGEWVDGGVRGTKAYSIPPKGVTTFGGFSIPAKESVTLSFKLKPLANVAQAEILVWSDKLQDNGRLVIDGLKKGDWKEVRIKATQLRIGAMGDGPSIDQLTNFKIFLLTSAPEARVLLDDFEIRE